MGRACILMSTYNGAKFLELQLDSLLCQQDCEVAIHIRDDGSTDGTIRILRDYARRDVRIHVYEHCNVGVTRSFLQLLKDSPAGCDGYFFCDQDDVWHPGKVATALRALGRADASEPALYCSRQRYVDEHGSPIGSSPRPVCVALANALVENIAIGCTIAMNQSARRQVISVEPVAAIMHDWWCYLVVSALGRVLYDESEHIDYRQHSGNTVGAASTGAGRWARRLRRRWSRPAAYASRAAQAAELLKLHGDGMTAAARALVDAFVSGKGSLPRRVGLVASRGVRRGGPFEQVVLSVQILLNDY